MKKMTMTGMALAFLLSGAIAFAAGPANGSQGGAGMQQQPMEQKPMKPMEKKARKMVHHRFTSEQVKEIQQALNANGAKLMVDGRWGRDSREAIKAYQKENGLKATGYANKKTRAKLGLKF